MSIINVPKTKFSSITNGGGFAEIKTSDGTFNSTGFSDNFNSLRTNYWDSTHITVASNIANVNNGSSSGGFYSYLNSKQKEIVDFDFRWRIDDMKVANNYSDITCFLALGVSGDSTLLDSTNVGRFNLIVDSPILDRRRIKIVYGKEWEDVITLYSRTETSLGEFGPATITSNHIIGPVVRWIRFAKAGRRLLCEWNFYSDQTTTNEGIDPKFHPFTVFKNSVEFYPAWFSSEDGVKGTQIWGNNSILTTTTVRYLQPGYGSGNAPISAIEYRLPHNANLKNLRVHCETAGVGAATLTFTLMVNGVASLLSASGSNTATDFTDLVNSVAVAAGDLISIKVTKSVAITTSPVDIMVSIEEST